MEDRFNPVGQRLMEDHLRNHFQTNWLPYLCASFVNLAFLL